MSNTQHREDEVLREVLNKLVYYRDRAALAQHPGQYTNVGLQIEHMECLVSLVRERLSSPALSQPPAQEAKAKPEVEEIAERVSTLLGWPREHLQIDEIQHALLVEIPHAHDTAIQEAVERERGKFAPLVGEYAQLQLAGRAFLSDIRRRTLRHRVMPEGYIISPATFAAFEDVLNSKISSPTAQSTDAN